MMNQIVQFGYEGHTRICCSSIMQSKWGGEGGSHILSQGWRGSQEGLNLLMRHLNSPSNKEIRHIQQRAKENFLQERANSDRKLHKASNRAINR